MLAFVKYKKNQMPEVSQQPENFQQEEIEIRSEEVQEILSHVPNWMIRWGNTLLLVFVVMLLAISWFVKYPDDIDAQIMITTSNPPQKLYANVGGRFDVFLVSDSDTVKKNTPLAVLKNSASYEDVLFLKSIIDTVTIDKSKDFFFPINELPPLILGDLNTSFSKFESDYDEYDSNKKLNPYQTELTANQFALVSARGKLQSMKEQQQLAQEQYEIQKSDFENRQKLLLEKGAISQKDFEDQKLQLLNAESNLKTMENSIAQIRENISNSTKTLKGGDIKQQQENNRLIRTVRQSFLQLKRDLAEWEEKFVLKSNIDGQVTFLSVWDKNQTVAVGDLIFTIIPIEERSYVGKIQAPAANSGKIKIGQRVQIQLANYPSDEYGELNGEIASITPVPNQDGNYLIDVNIDKELTTSYDKKIAFRQEMQGNAKIITEDLRLIERFFYQLKNIIE
jgi:multidrug efflux pump subunit AcrA (membrane-fusion protein)